MDVVLRTKGELHPTSRKSGRPNTESRGCEEKLHGQFYEDLVREFLGLSKCSVSEMSKIATQLDTSYG